MERYYYIKKVDGWVWSGYKFKKGGWRKAMLYKKFDTAVMRMEELMAKGYDCNIYVLEIREDSFCGK
jgi:hypothetical protein